MGDIADSLYEQMIDEAVFNFGYSEPKPPPTCKRCGVKNLTWVGVETAQGAKWRLFEDTKPHVCRMRDDEFEDLT